MNQGQNDAVFQTTRGFNLIFLHSSLDDAGLSPAEFRVLAHLSRRASGGSAWPAMETIAKVCKVNVKTARDAIKELMSRGMVAVKSRPGSTNLYQITCPEKWSLTPPKRSQGSDPTPPKMSQGTPPKMSQGYPSQKRGGEVYPIKEIQEVNPSAGASAPELALGLAASGRAKPASPPEVPDRLRTPEFLATWDAWQADRRARRKPVTSKAAELQLRKLSAMGPRLAVRSLEQSIENGWSGVFEVKEANGRHGNGAAREFRIGDGNL